MGRGRYEHVSVTYQGVLEYLKQCPIDKVLIPTSYYQDAEAPLR